MFHMLDLYTVVKLRAVTTEIKFDPVEIADCQWLDQKTFLESCHPYAKEFCTMALNNEHPIQEIPIARGVALCHT
jgi:NADH pyrophosphatase NudC (nudix superfamily)